VLTDGLGRETRISYDERGNLFAGKRTLTFFRPPAR